jgi:hypothetical protein
MSNYVEFPCPICYMETDFAEGHVCSNCIEERDNLRPPPKYFVLNVAVEND